MEKSKELKRQIRERIQKERGEYGRKRKKKFSHLKNTGEQGKIKGNIRGMKKIVVPFKPSDVPPVLPIVEKKGFVSKVKSLFKSIFKFK